MAFLGPDTTFSLSDGVSLGSGNVPLRISFDYFLDRDNVIKQIGKMKAKALRKAGYKVMQTARRSVKKMGMAKPKLAVMKQNPGMKLRELIASPSVSERDRNKVIKRLAEIRAKDASAPGTPPHTHTGMLRNNIVFAWDSTSESVVIGSFMRGGSWLSSLHEFGGSQQMQAWAWIPRYPNYTRGILAWWRIGTQPRHPDRWEQTRFRESKPYPARPYMGAAVRKCANNGEVVNQFRVGGL